MRRLLVLTFALLALAPAARADVASSPWLLASGALGTGHVGGSAVLAGPSAAGTSYVLLTGGYETRRAEDRGTPTDVTERRVPGGFREAGAFGGWRDAAPMPRPRAYHLSVALADGRVMVIGGRGPELDTGSTADLYDPRSDSWSTAAPMPEPFSPGLAVRLRDGRVLVAGGSSRTAISVASAAIYDPSTDTWAAAAPMLHSRILAPALLLPDGSVLVAGGEGCCARGGAPLADVERFVPATGTWVAAAPLPRAASSDPELVAGPGGTALLNDGLRVLRYDPASNTWTPAPALPGGVGGVAGYDPAIPFPTATLADGDVLVVGRSIAARLEPGATAWRVEPGPPLARSGPLLVATPDDGAQLIGGRLDEGSVLSSSDSYRSPRGLEVLRTEVRADGTVDVHLRVDRLSHIEISLMQANVPYAPPTNFDATRGEVRRRLRPTATGRRRFAGGRRLEVVLRVHADPTPAQAADFESQAEERDLTLRIQRRRRP